MSVRCWKRALRKVDWRTARRAFSRCAVTGGVGVGGALNANSATLTTALPVTNCGTGKTTSTGTGSAVLSGTPTITTPNMTGVTTGTRSAAGSIGELQKVSTSSTSLTTGTVANCSSVSLTAGDWLVSGTIQFVPSSGGSLTAVYSGINTTSAALPTYSQYNNDTAAFTLSHAQTQSTPPVPLLLTATTTVYLIGNANFSGTATCNGTIVAVRFH